MSTLLSQSGSVRGLCLCIQIRTEGGQNGNISQLHLALELALCGPKPDRSSDLLPHHPLAARRLRHVGEELGEEAVEVESVAAEVVGQGQDQDLQDAESLETDQPLHRQGGLEVHHGALGQLDPHRCCHQAPRPNLIRLSCRPRSQKTHSKCRWCCYHRTPRNPHGARGRGDNC